MKKDIILPNRYRVENKLTFLKEKQGKYYYKLELAPGEENCVRVSAGEDGKFDFPHMVDPSGGPYMEINSFVIEGMKLVKLLWRKGTGIIMMFEDNKD